MPMMPVTKISRKGQASMGTHAVDLQPRRASLVGDLQSNPYTTVTRTRSRRATQAPDQQVSRHHRLLALGHQAVTQVQQKPIIWIIVIHGASIDAYQPP